MIKKYLFLLGIVANLTYVNGQSKVDSIVSVLPEIKEDTTRLKAYYRLLYLMTFDNPERALEYGFKAEELAHLIGKYETEVEAQTSLGYVYEVMGNGTRAFEYYNKGYLNARKIEYLKGQLDGLLGNGSAKRLLGELDSAIYFYTEAMNLAKANNKDLLFADANNNIGNVYLDRDQFEKALEHYLVCARILPDDNRVKSIVTINIGLVHYELGNLELSKEYFEKGISLAEGISDLWLIAFNLQKLGMIEKEQHNYDAALSYYRQSKAAYQQLNNRRQELLLNTNIGNLYLAEEKFNEAIEMFRTSTDNIQESDEATNQAHALIGLSTAYVRLEDYEKALTHTNRLIDLCIEIESPLQHANGLNLLSDIYANTGQFEKAYLVQKELAILQDSIFNTAKSEQILDMEAKYENDRKEQEIDLLNAEKEITELRLSRQENLRNYLIIIAAIILILAFVIFNQYKTKVKANNKLRELDGIKTRFFTNISHEFRTPLTLIIGPAKSRLSEAKVNEESEFLKLIIRNAERLLQLINQLLDLAKLDASQMKLQQKEADVNQFIINLTSSFESLAIEKDIKYERNIPSTFCSILFDHDKLHKIITNLLSNAFKFTPAKGTVRFESQCDEKCLTISVSDTGKGIRQDMIEGLFGRFNQLDEDTYDGTGIGLALTKELVELHDGKIEVDSREGEGSTFRIWIPISKHSKASMESTDRTPNEAFNMEAEGLSEVVIDEREFDDAEASLPILLIVEDNADVRNYIGKVFKDTYQIQTAGNGEEGLEKALKTIPDLIISDLMMPKMDGMEMCRLIKTDERTSHIPVILLTAKASIESKIKGLHTGADDYLTKPFNQDELMVRAANLIEQRSRLRKLFGSSVTLEPTMISITPPDEVFLTKAKNLVEENMNNFDFTVEQFQQIIGMSRMQLHRKLKALTNSSTSEFIRTIRLQRAAQILQTKGVNVSEAAYSAGFNNLSYFAKCFKEHFGMNPSEYTGKQESNNEA